MKYMFLIILAFLMTTFSFAGNALDAELAKYYAANKVDVSTIKPSNEYAVSRRLYLDLAGRIPTLKELESLAYNMNRGTIQITDPSGRIIFDEKRRNPLESQAELILSTGDYVDNFYNLFADMFRIRPERLSDNIGFYKSYPYMQYVRDSLKSNKPYNVWVKEMLTAKGKYTENPATGYLLRDNGMLLDNLATTLQLFLGKDMACAQCHDDPFQDYTQLQFYQMAAFLGSTENRNNGKEYRDALKRVDEDIKKITGTDRIDNGVRQLMSANMFDIQEMPSKNVKLPHDYQYKDAKPFDVIAPKSLDGKSVPKENYREAFADWIITQDNFSMTIANRIWEKIVGAPLVGPINNIDNGFPTENIPILKFLGKYLENHDYDLRKLITLIVSSDFYCKQAYSGKLENYKLQGVLVKRMTAYQLWDSMLTLILPAASSMAVDYNSYSNLVKVDFNTVYGQGVLDQMKTIQAYEQKLNSNILKFQNVELIRASRISARRGFVGTFLKEFGSSDRILIDAADDQGSITQLLFLMNSPITNVIADAKCQPMLNYEEKGKDKEAIFKTILGRPSGISEKGTIMKAPANDLVWALLNSKEFIFIK